MICPYVKLDLFKTPERLFGGGNYLELVWVRLSGSNERVNCPIYWDSLLREVQTFVSDPVTGMNTANLFCNVSSTRKHIPVYMKHANSHYNDITRSYHSVLHGAS